MRMRNVLESRRNSVESELHQLLFLLCRRKTTRLVFLACGAGWCVYRKVLCKHVKLMKERRQRFRIGSN